MAGVESEVKSEVKPEDGGMAETKQEESEVKPEKTGISAFERKRLENIAANQALLKDLSTTANKVIPKPPPKPAAAPKKRRREAPAPRESTRPTRTSSRLAGIEADDEVARRKAEENAEVAREETKAKRTRISGDLNLSDVAVGGKGLSDLTGIVRGAQPYERTFNEEDIQETTDVDLKSLREKMSGLKLYENWLPNDIKITPERVYSMGFHPLPDKPVIFAGDKLGNLGVFDASQKVELDDDGDPIDSPDISVFKYHSRTVSCLLFPPNAEHVYSASYDSSIRKLDVNKQAAIEVYAPPGIDDEEAISAIEMPRTDPNVLYFSRLDGAFGRHDIRTPSSTKVWQLGDKKIGGFSLHPSQPHLFATASLDRTLKIWDLRMMTGTGEDKQPGLLGEHTSRLSVSHAAWSSAGHIATTSYDNTVKIHSFPNSKSWGAGNLLTEEDMEPTSVIKHNNQTGRWVTILKAQWQQRPDDGIHKLVIGNMNRFVDIYTSEGEQLAQLDGEGISAVPAVAQFHPTKNWVAGGTASGKLCLWM